MVEQQRNALGERVRLAGWDEQAGLAMTDDLDDPADGGRDDRDAGGHGFEDGIGKCFRL